LSSPSPDQQLTRKLAELKTFIDRRIKQQEDEVATLRSYMEVVDSLLAERSFRPVQINTSTVTTPTPPPTPATSSPSNPERSLITTTNGVTIASIHMEPEAMHVVPEPDMHLDSNSPPLRAFLLGKILDPMQTKDKEAATTGAIQPDAILSYDLEQQDGFLKALHIRNYGDDRRVLELKNAIRWTFRRMYEKIPAKK
jgi:hypothetical protein